MTINSPAETSQHLSVEQLDALLGSHAQSDMQAASAQAHLVACEKCTAELASLRVSFSLFRQASTAYAEQQLRTLQPRSSGVHSPALQPAYWALAAASLFFAAFLPMQMLQRHSAAAPASTFQAADRTTLSDEALLNSVASDLSESVPSPMQALADPSTGLTATQPSPQRKD